MEKDMNISSVDEEINLTELQNKLNRYKVILTMDQETMRISYSKLQRRHVDIQKSNLKNGTCVWADDGFFGIYDKNNFLHLGIFPDSNHRESDVSLIIQAQGEIKCASKLNWFSSIDYYYNSSGKKCIENHSDQLCKVSKVFSDSGICILKIIKGYDDFEYEESVQFIEPDIPEEKETLNESGATITKYSMDEIISEERFVNKGWYGILDASGNVCIEIEFVGQVGKVMYPILDLVIHKYDSSGRLKSSKHYVNSEAFNENLLFEGSKLQH